MAYPGYEISELDGLPVLRCLDCRQWCRPGGKVRHSRRCATTSIPLFAYADAPGHEEQTRAAHEPRRGGHLTAAQVRRAGRRGEISAAMTDDEVLEAVRAGVLSSDDAMNRDF